MSDTLDTAMAGHQEFSPEVVATPGENRRLGIWIFLASESAFFASLIGTYLANYQHYAPGLGPNLFDLPLTTFNTFVLLMSSLTMGLGVAALHRGRQGSMMGWLVVTALLGLLFLSLQAYEFLTFWHHGLTLTSSLFGSSFFTLTGFHGLHVAFGVTWILAVLLHSLRHDMTGDNASKVEVAGLYWHFVDVVWVVIFTVVYLMGKVS